MDYLQGKTPTPTQKNSILNCIIETILPSLRTYSTQLFQKGASTLLTSTPDQIATTLQTEYLEPYILHPLSTVIDFSTSSSNLVSAVILLLTLYISLRILDYARRVVMFWVMLVVRLTFWAAVLSVGVYVYNVGPEKAVKDAGWIWGVAQGFVEDFVASAEANSGRRPAGGYGGGSYGYGNSRQERYRGARRGVA
jgi:Nuclear pore assembly and biogenesis